MRNPLMMSVALSLTGLALAACSPSTSAPGSAPSSAAAVDSPSPSSTMIGTVLPPIEITQARKNVEVTVGDTLNVTTADVTKVTTDNAEVLTVSQPRDDGSAQFNAGAEVVSAGTAELTVYGVGGKELYTATVTASE